MQVGGSSGTFTAGGPPRRIQVELGDVSTDVIFLDIGGKLVVPSVSSADELRESLSSGRIRLRFDGMELRAAASVRRKLFTLLNCDQYEFNHLLSRLLLKALASPAPPGTRMKNPFLKKGYRDGIFESVRQKALERRKELEKEMNRSPPAVRPASDTLRTHARKVQTLGSSSGLVKSRENQG